VDAVERSSIIVVVAALAAMAPISLAATRVQRAMTITGIALTTLIIGAIVTADGVRVNLSDSVPIGLYGLSRPSLVDLRRGTMVAVCPPGAVVRIAENRGYLASGSCASGAAPLLKMVLAVGGDEVRLKSDGITVNGCSVRNTSPLARDSAGRALGHWPFARSVVPAKMLWLYGPNPRSWDSRYWGPLPTADVIAIAQPLLKTTIHSLSCAEVDG